MPEHPAFLDRGRPVFTPANRDEPADRDHWRVSAGPSGGSVDIPDLDGRVIADGDQLVYDVLPVAAVGGGVEDRYGATAVAIDLVLDDGSTLAGLVDQYGTALTDEAQAAAKRLWVDQWNRRVVDLSRVAGRRILAVRAVLGPAATDVEVFVDLAIRPVTPRPGDLLGWVDTRRGTHSSDRFSRGNNAPLVTVPHGGVFGIPMTDASVGNWPYRWRMARPSLQAFATSHIPSPWAGDRGVFQLMPSVLDDVPTAPVDRALFFDRETESARPDRYEVALDDGRGGVIRATIAPARHALGFRFAADDDLSLVIDHLGTAVEARWEQVDDALVIEVRLHDSDIRPDHFIAATIPGVIRADLRHEHGRLSGRVRLAAPSVDVIVGVSTIDVRQARVNAAEGGGIDRMLADAGDAWRHAFARVEIADADAVAADTLRSIAGSLQRLFSYPNAFDEPGPDGAHHHTPGDGRVRPGVYSANNGFWDTYRTAWPLLGLLAPQATARLADGFVQHFRDEGWVARWSAPGPEDSMTGTTSDTVFAGLSALRVPFDVRGAYDSALRHATVPAANARVGRKGLHRGIFRGFIDTDTHEGMSWTLDNAINDSSAARLARVLADAESDAAERERLEAEAEYLARRALGYRAVFHPELGFFLGRLPSGQWRVSPDRFDPAEWGYDYTETNAWGTAFTAPHDGAGLAGLFGGERELGEALDAFFAAPETADPATAGSYGFVIHEQAEARDVRMGMLGLSNQPAHHIPLMYTFAGRHDDAHRIVVEARDRLFVGSDLGQGYPGDEDNGEMSAWYLFAVLGIYPLVPGAGEFVLTPPLLERVVLHPQGRAPLEITAANAGASYIRSVRIDGEPYEHIAVSAERLLTATRIEFKLSDQPTGWASETRPTSASIESAVAAAPDDLLERRENTVTDDARRTAVALEPGDAVVAHLVSPAVVALYTVTLAGADAPYPFAGGLSTSVGWRLVGLTPAGEEVELDRRDETFDIAGQTRPFRVSAVSAPLASIRLEATTAMTLAQLEAFGA